ncbi:hypothetical protein J3R82DRAFT_1434 [Butyriboletus roseoflavus]|nr:hypothetical protein J3R82DRAFT_1434 [Butyriboletus roseoflavus]
MTFTERAHTEPPPSGFMNSVMHHHDMDNLDEGIMMLNQPQKQITQEEQDAMDDKARKRAMGNLVNSWQERLQLISVITTFFATTEAAMLVNTKPVIGLDWNNNVLKASNASLLGALILHVYAAVLSFLGAFLLIRYKLQEATREEMIAEGIKMVNSPVHGSVMKDVERDPVDFAQQTLTSIDAQSTIYKSVNEDTAKPTPARDKRGSYPLEPPIISANPHIEQVGPFMSNVSSHLLSRTHTLCVFLAAVGFVLAIAGVLCYAWASQPIAVSIFASTCLGGSILAMVALLLPSPNLSSLRRLLIR